MGHLDVVNSNFENWLHFIGLALAIWSILVGIFQKETDTSKILYNKILPALTGAVLLVICALWFVG